MHFFLSHERAHVPIYVCVRVARVTSIPFLLPQEAREKVIMRKDDEVCVVILHACIMRSYLSLSACIISDG